MSCEKDDSLYDVYCKKDEKHGQTKIDFWKCYWEYDDCGLLVAYQRNHS